MTGERGAAYTGDVERLSTEETEVKTATAPVGERFSFYDVDWAFYDLVLSQVEDRPVFVTYDRGSLEVMSPSASHESSSGLIGRLIEELTLELNIPIRSGRSTTFRREDLERGLEPDECYWIQNEARVRGAGPIDLRRDPPPDLAVEVEITSRLLDRVGIYAALGVPELWRFDGEKLRVCILGADGRYADSDHSRALPRLPIGEVVRFLNMPKTMDETTLVRSFREWIRANLGGA